MLQHEYIDSKMRGTSKKTHAVFCVQHVCCCWTVGCDTTMGAEPWVLERNLDHNRLIIQQRVPKVAQLHIKCVM